MRYEIEEGIAAIDMLIFKDVPFHWIYIDGNEQIRLVQATIIDNRLASSATYFGLSGVE